MPKRKIKSSTTRERSGTDGILSHERNWSELPEDIVNLLSKKLPNISDFICFRIVCKSWQLSAPVTDPPPQLPWLLENRFIEHSEKGIIRFYCLWSGKVHTITCPGSRHARLKGPACRYLLAYHMRNSERYLLNPLTRAQIHVPFVKECGFFPDYICPDPIEGGDIVVMLGNNNMMAFWRPEAGYLVFVEGVSNYYSGNTYYMGQYFTSDINTGITNVIDIVTKKLAYQVAPPEGTNPFLKGCTFLVELGGKILMLFQYYEDKQYRFVIYYLYFDNSDGKPCWLKISDIDDKMLIVGYHSLRVTLLDLKGIAFTS